MLYEVITLRVDLLYGVAAQGIGTLGPEGITDASEGAAIAVGAHAFVVKIVITSYSIHYTKLYEVEGARPTRSASSLFDNRALFRRRRTIS